MGLAAVRMDRKKARVKQLRAEIHIWESTAVKLFSKPQDWRQSVRIRANHRKEGKLVQEAEEEWTQSQITGTEKGVFQET